MDTQQSAYWTNERIASTILAGILTFWMLMKPGSVLPEWYASIEAIMLFFMLIIAILPLIAPLVEMIQSIVSGKMIGLIFAGAFVLLSLLKMILGVASVSGMYFACFSVLFRAFLIESALCFGAYFHTIMSGKITP